MLLGFEIGPKIFLSASMSFFPIFINLTNGLKYINPDLLDVLKIYKANKMQILIRARIPNSLPEFFAGLKIALPLSIIGVIVGEFLGSEKGIGYLIVNSQSNLDTPAVFAEILVIIFMSVGLFRLINYIEKRVVYWR
jgi:NitT/TauT family transport system permease protein